jgi:hypothetical protein
VQSEAKFLPKEFFKCKELKPTAAAVAAEPNPGPGAGCSMAVDKKACGKEKGCLWCEGGFGPGSCYDEVGLCVTRCWGGRGGLPKT